jgi:hypothetical protein
MYSNTPKSDVTNTMNSVSSKIVETNHEEIVHILETVTEPNYLQFDQQNYRQIDGIAMGAPTSVK